MSMQALSPVFWVALSRTFNYASIRLFEKWEIVLKLKGDNVSAVAHVHCL